MDINNNNNNNLKGSFAWPSIEIWSQGFFCRRLSDHLLLSRSPWQSFSPPGTRSRAGGDCDGDGDGAVDYGDYGDDGHGHGDYGYWWFKVIINDSHSQSNLTQLF